MKILFRYFKYVNEITLYLKETFERNLHCGYKLELKFLKNFQTSPEEFCESLKFVSKKSMRQTKF